MDENMNYLLLFLTDGVLGYFLQGMGYVIGLNAFTRKKFRAWEFILTSIGFSLIIFGIRSMSIISFGFHTIMILISFILIYAVFLKTNMFYTVVGTLVTVVVTTVAEVLNMLIMLLMIGRVRLDTILGGTDTIDGKIAKAVIGIPTNIILLSVVLLIHYFIRRSDKANEFVKKDSE